jgi:CRP-like cAMP-binding protein
MPSRTARAVIRNQLLDCLPLSDCERLLARGTRVELALSDVLCEPGQRMAYVFFPTSSFISIISRAERKARLEMGLIGNEGMLGASLILGVKSAPQLATVQGAGAAWRIKASLFSLELKRSAALRREVSRYLYVTMCQWAQTAVCTHFHGVEARLARWLLMTADRAHGDTFYITQTLLSLMLGVRRETVAKAASSLQERRIIGYSRGHVSILDRRRLQSIACVCYRDGILTYARELKH